MIEAIENGAQLVVVTICLILSLRFLLRGRQRAYELTVLFYSCYMLGNLYWQLHLLFYGKTPLVFYVSDVCWLAAWLFIYCLLRLVSTPEERRLRHPVLLLLPVFAAAMAVFYMQWGGFLSNVTSAIMMSFLMIHAVRGLLFLLGRREPRKVLYLAALFYCFCEYLAWTASCYYWPYSVTSPYIWSDVLLTVSIVLLLPAARKAVRE